MKSSGLIAVLTMMMVFFSHGNALSTGDLHDSEANHFEIVSELTIEPGIIHFDAGMVEVISFEVAKNYDKIFKHKFYQKGNEQVNQSVEDYIFCSNSSPHHCPGLHKLRRLNT